MSPLALPAPDDAAIRKWDASFALRLGLLSVFVLVFGLGAWAAFASISGAVVASGRLKVQSERQVVQHLEGGVVDQILVKEGDIVEAGDVLVRLDDTQLRAELAIVESQLWETLARVARLEAEQASEPALRFNDDLLAAAAGSEDVAALVRGQQRLFEARLDTVRRETEQLRERQIQIRDEIGGAEAQRASLERQLDFIDEELEAQRTLLDRGLTQASRVLALEREKARLEGQAGGLTAQIAQSRGRITEIDIQLVGLEAVRIEEAITQLRDLKTNEAELRERRLSIVDTLDRLDIRAPRSGAVLGQTVFAERAVIRPAEPVLYIVPTNEALVVEARIEPQNVDQVYPGQPARLRFSAFNQRTTPEVDSAVLRVSADAFTDEQTGVSYYTADLAVTERTMAQLGDVTLVAGMPVDAFIQTGERSPLSYFMRPMADFFARSMREE